MYRLLFFALIFITGCSDSGTSKSDPLESGREFIESSLKGDYDEAKKYMLSDSLNLDYFNKLVEFYNRSSEEDKTGYKNANIIINGDGIEHVSDSVTIIHYSNSFKNKPSKIKMVKKSNEWLVDFKYTFSGNL